MTRTLGLGLVAFALLACGCGRSFDVKTAPGFVALKDQEPAYAYRAVSPEGVVVGVRALSLDDARSEGGDLSFWTRALTLRLRDEEGYALLDARDVRSGDGTPGKELDFGHDENGKPYTYRVRVFVAKDKLYVIEAGGAKPEMDRYRASVDWMLGTLRVK